MAKRLTRLTRAELESERAELELELTRARNENCCFFEWFYSVECGHDEATLDVRIDGRTVSRVRVRGLQRALGGVAVVEWLDPDLRDPPRLLADLIARWRVDASVALRDAARQLADLAATGADL